MILFLFLFFKFYDYPHIRISQSCASCVLFIRALQAVPNIYFPTLHHIGYFLFPSSPYPCQQRSSFFVSVYKTSTIVFFSVPDSYRNFMQLLSSPSHFVLGFNFLPPYYMVNQKPRLCQETEISYLCYLLLAINCSFLCSRILVMHLTSECWQMRYVILLTCVQVESDGLSWCRDGYAIALIVHLLFIFWFILSNTQGKQLSGD